MYSGSTNNWIFIEDDPFVSRNRRAKFNNIGIAETHLYYGLWDHSQDNQNIKNLLNDFEISSATTESLSKILKESFNKNNDPIIFEQKTNTKIANYFEKDEKIYEIYNLKYFWDIGLSSTFQGNTKYISYLFKISDNFTERRSRLLKEIIDDFLVKTENWHNIK